MEEAEWKRVEVWVGSVLVLPTERLEQAKIHLDVLLLSQWKPTYAAEVQIKKIKNKKKWVKNLY